MAQKRWPLDLTRDGQAGGAIALSCRVLAGGRVMPAGKTKEEQPGAGLEVGC